MEWSASRPGRTLGPGKGSPLLIVQESGLAPEPVWTQSLEQKSFLSLQGIEPGLPSRRARSQTILTEPPGSLSAVLLKKNLHTHTL
jgi:hypothetical protein